MSLQEYQQARCFRYFAVFQGQQSLEAQTFLRTNGEPMRSVEEQGRILPGNAGLRAGAGGKVALL